MHRMDDASTMTEPNAVAKTSVYRVMIIRGDDVVSTLPLPDQISSDSQAKAVARAMVSSCAVELWDGLRFIEHFDSGAANRPL